MSPKARRRYNMIIDYGILTVNGKVIQCSDMMIIKVSKERSANIAFNIVGEILNSNSSRRKCDGQN
jgi:hypothetical protein